MLNIIRKNSFVLALFGAITTGLTALVNMVTQPIISYQTVMQKKKLLNQVVPSELYNNVMQNECYIITDMALGNDKPHHLYVARKDNRPVAIALETTAPDGYAGAIQMIVGVDFHGKILGVRVLKHHETPGLGDRIELRVSDWISHFSGVQLHDMNDLLHFAVRKDGGDFDQFTGATITPRAVVNATKHTTLFIQTLLEKLPYLPRCGNINE